MRTMHEFLGLPVLLAFAAIAAEFFGGAALIVGLLSPVAAVGIGAIMVFAILMVHRRHGLFLNWFGDRKGHGYEYHLLALAFVATWKPSLAECRQCITEFSQLPIFLIAPRGVWSVPSLLTSKPREKGADEPALYREMCPPLIQHSNSSAGPSPPVTVTLPDRNTTVMPPRPETCSHRPSYLPAQLESPALGDCPAGRAAGGGGAVEARRFSAPVSTVRSPSIATVLSPGNWTLYRL